MCAPPLSCLVPPPLLPTPSSGSAQCCRLPPAPHHDEKGRSNIFKKSNSYSTYTLDLTTTTTSFVSLNAKFVIDKRLHFNQQEVLIYYAGLCNAFVRYQESRKMAENHMRCPIQRRMSACWCRDIPGRELSAYGRLVVPPIWAKGQRVVNLEPLSQRKTSRRPKSGDDIPHRVAVKSVGKISYCNATS
jgi:hypothetical protein